MIDEKLNATHLGAKVTIESGGEGNIKAYSNVTRVVSVTVSGRIQKFPYDQLTLEKNA